MKLNIVNSIEKEVIRRCKSSDNSNGYGAWTHHIKQVVDNAIILAKKYDTDVEIVTLAALLHDIASVTKAEYKEEHHIHGAEIAQELLSDLSYSQDKIDQVKKCILNHRGSRLHEKNTIEEVCVSDADAMAHFDNIPSLFNLVYREKKMSIDEGLRFVKSKLDRSYNKLSDDTKKLYKKKYNCVMDMFNNGDKND